MFIADCFNQCVNRHEITECRPTLFLFCLHLTLLLLGNSPVTLCDSGSLTFENKEKSTFASAFSVTDEGMLTSLS